MTGSRIFASRGLAVVVTVVILLFALPLGATRNHVAMVVQLVCAILGGLSVLRPVTAGTLLGITATANFLREVGTGQPGGAEYLGLAVVAEPIVVAVTATRGMRFLALVFALWYVTVSIASTSRNVGSTVELTQAVNFWLVFMFAPLLLGDVIRRIQQRAERQRREQAVASERQRRAIARDLHDTLAYATTTMVMKAEQARLRGGHDEQTLADLDFIATTGRSAAADLRTMVALLRDKNEAQELGQNPAGMLPANPLEEVIDAQRAKLTAFDFDVNFALTGDPTMLPDRLSTVLARVLTEVASNITKHADPCHEVTLMIDLDGPEIEAVFVNSTRKSVSESSHRGMGLLGLQEIVTVEGGTLQSGPVGERWITHVTLPQSAAYSGKGDGGD